MDDFELKRLTALRLHEWVNAMYEHAVLYGEPTFELSSLVWNKAKEAVLAENPDLKA